MAIGLIALDPSQPREIFPEAKLAELTESIRERGILQPIRVRWDEGRGMYIVIAGERRYRAACAAGLAGPRSPRRSGRPGPGNRPRPGRAGGKAKAKLEMSAIVRTAAGCKVTVENRRGLDDAAILEALEEASRQVRERLATRSEAA